MLFNDLLSYLSDVLDDEDSEVAVIGRSLTKLLENITGEKLKDLVEKGNVDL